MVYRTPCPPPTATPHKKPLLWDFRVRFAADQVVSTIGTRLTLVFGDALWRRREWQFRLDILGLLDLYNLYMHCRDTPPGKRVPLQCGYPRDFMDDRCPVCIHPLHVPTVTNHLHVVLGEFSTSLVIYAGIAFP